MKIFSRFIFVVFAVTCFPLALLADTPAPNQPQKIYSANEKFYIEMQPQGGWGGYGKGKGTAYQILPDGTEQEIWSVPVYAAGAALTNDGKHLIVFGPWASKTSDLAVAFYLEGRELKSYQVKDLIEDEMKLQHTVSHFFWASGGGKFSEDETRWTLTLIDSRSVTFNPATGERIA